jgi:hypothetical protein
MLMDGYNLDSHKQLNIHKLKFKDTFSYLELDTNKYSSLSAEVKYQIIEELLVALDSSTNKGFLNSFDLTKYPIITDLIPCFIHVGSKDYEEYVRGVKSMELYK